MAGDPTPALTGRRRTRPTPIGCRNPWQPKPGRAPLIAGQAAVQTNPGTSGGYGGSQGGSGGWSGHWVQTGGSMHCTSYAGCRRPSGYPGRYGSSDGYRPTDYPGRGPGGYGGGGYGGGAYGGGGYGGGSAW